MGLCSSDGNVEIKGKDMFDWNEETDGVMPANDPCIEENAVQITAVSEPPATGSVYGKTYIGLFVLALIGAAFCINKLKRRKDH